MRRGNQVGNAPVAARGDLGHRGVTVQAQEAHGRGQHTRAFVLALVEHLTGSGCHHRVRRATLLRHQVRRRHHAVQRHLEGTGRVGEKVGDTAQGLVFASIEHVEDGAHQQRMAGLLPVVAPLQCPFRIHQDVGDVLHVAHLVHAAPHFQQGVVGRRAYVGRVEQQAVREARTPARGEMPVLSLDIVDNGGTGPGQQRGHHQAHALARARGGEGHHMFRSFMTQVSAVPARCPAEEHTRRTGKPYLIDVLALCPAGGAIGGDKPRQARAPQRHADGHTRRKQAAGSSDGAAAREDLGRIGVVPVPPLEQLPGLVDRKP